MSKHGDMLAIFIICLILASSYFVIEHMMREMSTTKTSVKRIVTPTSK